MVGAVNSSQPIVWAHSTVPRAGSEATPILRQLGFSREGTVFGNLKRSDDTSREPVSLVGSRQPDVRRDTFMSIGAAAGLVGGLALAGYLHARFPNVFLNKAALTAVGFTVGTGGGALAGLAIASTTKS